MSKSLLIIFAKNPELGKVKTRLAATVGNEKALAIYHLLLSHTINVTESLPIDKAVFYSDYIDKEDKWENSIYQKFKQVGDDLGERMHNAFQKGFDLGYQDICIIGTDNMEITSVIISNGFASLNSNGAVIGPAKDGGYYLLGMKQLHPQLFENKPWSTDVVFKNTTEDFKNLDLNYKALPVLNDVDTEEDWLKSTIYST